MKCLEEALNELVSIELRIAKLTKIVFDNIGKVPSVNVGEVIPTETEIANQDESELNELLTVERQRCILELLQAYAAQQLANKRL